MRVEQQKAYIIHTRAFRDTSLLIDCYTKNYGRLSLIAKGARSAKNKNRALLQPFQLLSISWQGRGNLKTLIDIESLDRPISLKDHYLYSGLYINELFLYLLPVEDASDTLFEQYHEFLTQIKQQAPLEPMLRQFELSLLQELGYGIDFYSDVYTAEPINSDQQYVYFPGYGFANADATQAHNAMRFDGHILATIAEGHFRDAAVLKQAKVITRLSIEAVLEGKPLKSREFFKQIVN